MNLLAAALATAASSYLLLAALSGRLPQLGRHRTRPGARPSHGDTLRQWLTQGGVGLSPTAFVLSCAALGLTVLAATAALTSAPAVALAPAVASALLPRTWVASRRERRLREVARAWPDGLRELIGALTAGMSLPQALTSLATSGPEPLRQAFARFPALARMAGVVPALELLRAELADPTSDRVLEVLIVAHERGGRIIVELLRDLAEATTEDLRVDEEIATAGLEQRINARTVFVLPWLVLVALTASPGAFREFYRSAGGLLVIGLAAAVSLVGNVLVGRLARDPIEPRVVGEPTVVGELGVTGAAGGVAAETPA